MAVKKINILFLLAILAFFLILFFLVRPFYFKPQKNSPSLNFSDNFQFKVLSILSSLTLEQKVAQLFIVGFKGDNPEEALKFFDSFVPGGVLLLERNIKGPKELKNLTSALQRFSQEKVSLPLIISVDQEGFPVCRVKFLTCKNLNHFQNKASAYNLGKLVGKELKGYNINLNFAPVSEKAKKGDFIFSRAIQGENRKEIIEAFWQGEKDSFILTTLKHFPGYSKISFNPERDSLPVLNKAPLEDFEKFKGFNFLMLSNVVYKDIDQKLPFSLSFKGVSLARKIFGSDKIIIPDDLSSPVLKENFGIPKLVNLFFSSDLDMFLVAGFDDPQDVKNFFDLTLLKFKNKQIDVEILNRKVKKIIEFKLKYEKYLKSKNLP